TTAYSSALALHDALPISVSPTNLSFGTIVTGNSTTQNITLSNTGGSSISVSGASVTGTGFSLAGSTFPISIAAGGSATLPIKFAPTSTRGCTAAVAITSS